MQKQKLVYEVPQTDALVVRFEESILQVTSPKLGDTGGAGAAQGFNSYGDAF